MPLGVRRVDTMVRGAVGSVGRALEAKEYDSEAMRLR